MSNGWPAQLKSRFASFGYAADGFIIGMMDIIGVVDDDSQVPVNEACMLGSAPTGLFSGMATGTIAIHRSTHDGAPVWDFLMPWEVRMVYNKGTRQWMTWDQAAGLFAWRVE
jgi:hypothetical protein